MSYLARKLWTVEEFFAWQETVPDRYELVGGLPLRMMAGAKNVHDRIVVNILSDLRQQLRGTPCRPFTGDCSVQTYPGQIRRPDIGVDCGAFHPEGFTADRPVVVIEVLSPTTRDFDTLEKVEEYRQVASIAHILFVEPNAPVVLSWARGADGWSRSVLEALDQAVDLHAVGARLALGEIYDGITFQDRPRLF